ncbi:hypothetical protein NL676_009080 [Syzygium grande]|nr:hypothetical protein NL676_009080 [Syzygium grande]
MGTLVQEAKIEGLGRLRALRQLTLCVEKMALPPTDFSSLSQLQRLCVSCADSRSLTRLPTSLRELDLEDVQSPIDWSLFSNLENLSSLNIGRYTLGEIRFEALGKLPKLFMAFCPLLETLTILRGLKEIQQLSLFGLPRLTEIHGSIEMDKIDNLGKGAYGSALQNLNEMMGLPGIQQLFSSIHISERAELLNIYIGTCEQAFFNELDGVGVLTGVFVLAGTRITVLLDAALLRPGRLEDFCSVIFLLYRIDWISLKYYQGSFLWPVRWTRTLQLKM